MKPEEAATRSNAQSSTQTTSHSREKVLQTAVSVVGLGKLGACMAAAIASQGVCTIGVGVNPASVEKVRQKLAPVFEPGLARPVESDRRSVASSGGS